MKTYTHNWLETEHGITVQAIEKGGIVAAASYRAQDKALIMHRPPTVSYGIATDCEALNGGHCETKLLGNDRRMTREVEFIEMAGGKQYRYKLMENILDKILSE